MEKITEMSVLADIATKGDTVSDNNSEAVLLQSAGRADKSVEAAADIAVPVGKSKPVQADEKKKAAAAKRSADAEERKAVAAKKAAAAERERKAIAAKKSEETERRKREGAMRTAKLLFRAIDILYSRSQNSCPYVNKKNEASILCDSDIVYDEKESEVCKFDYYRVESDKKLPAILLIHGGGFTAGDKKYRKGRAQYFALNGFAVFCINYGLAPDYIFPEPLVHIVTAANFIYDHAEQYNIDTQKIIVDGDSAGGYYAAMLAAFNGNETFKSGFGFAPKFDVFGALLNCGLYDMDTVLHTKYPFDIADGVLLSLIGIRGSDFDGYEHKDICVPLDYVGKNFPPTFVIYSDGDVFCKGQANKFIDKLNAAGVYCEYYAARKPLSNHCFSLTWTGEDACAANELMMSFAKRLAGDKIKL